VSIERRGGQVEQVKGNGKKKELTRGKGGKRESVSVPLLQGEKGRGKLGGKSICSRLFFERRTLPLQVFEKGGEENIPQQKKEKKRAGPP